MDTPQMMETPPAPSQRQRVGSFARRNGLQIGIVGVLVIILVFLMIAAPRAFLNKEIYGSLMSSVPFYGMIALPLTLLIIAKEIDLSFGSIMAMSVVGYLETFGANSKPGAGADRLPAGRAAVRAD